MDRGVAGEDQPFAAAIVPANRDVAVVWGVVVVLFDPVAVPAVRAIVVGKRTGFEIVAHVGGCLRADRCVGADLLDAGGLENLRVLGIGQVGFDGVDDTEARN